MPRNRSTAKNTVPVDAGLHIAVYSPVDITGSSASASARSGASLTSTSREAHLHYEIIVSPHFALARRGTARVLSAFGKQSVSNFSQCIHGYKYQLRCMRWQIFFQPSYGRSAQTRNRKHRVVLSMVGDVRLEPELCFHYPAPFH